MTVTSSIPLVQTRAPADASGRLARLDALLDRTPSELAELYRRATVPALGAVRGDLRGRMLAWPALERRAALSDLLRAFASSPAFPWRGKTFRPHDDERGEGKNRVVSDRLRLFRFDTFVAPSRAGCGDAVQLDYDVDGNPALIRRIKDEIRELEPGLWLGQAYLQTKRRDVLWLYFALASAPGAA
jgi:hypothetical protein